MKPIRTTLLAATALALGLSTPALAAETPADDPAAAIPLGKLAGDFKPAAYRLDLTVDPAKERFSGHVEIDGATIATGSLYLHGRDLTVRSASARIGGRTIAAAWQQVDETGVARLTFAEALPTGPVTLSFDYDTAFASGPAGLFRVHVGDQWYAWSQFESIDARAAFPGFDQPGFKTPITVTMRTPKGLTAVSNAPEVSAQEEGGMTVHRFAPTLPLPTYLVAMMVGPFATVSSTVPPSSQRSQPLPLRVVSPQTNAGQLTYALENSKRILTLLEDYFGQPFPYPKLDQITSPIMPGAMENPGADLYGDSIIVLDENAPVQRKRRFGMVVAHELAHQWFGDLVTPAWWDDIWLNESFANWMGFRIGNAWKPELHIDSGATAEGFAAMNNDALIAGRPIHQTIARNAQIDAAFDNITYGKGGHVIAMIAGFMGDDKFREGVRRYMAAHKYGNATSADFFAAMAEVAGDPRILPAMQGFTDQQGVPLLTFTRAGKSLIVAQSRYARLGTVAPDTRWAVPMCLRLGEERTCQLLDGKETRIAAKGGRVLMPNAGGTGYYRFELPAKDWDALVGSADRLSGNEAIALADSLRASYLAGRSSVTRLAALAGKLSQNSDSHAFGDALDGLETLRGAGMFDAAAGLAYRRFVARLYLPVAQQLGFDPARGAYAAQNPETVERRRGAVTALAAIARVKETRETLAQATTRFLAGDSTALDPMWYDLGFSTYLSGGGLDAAKHLFDRALGLQDPVLRPTLLGVVAESGDPAIGHWVLDEATDPRLRPSERLNMIRGVIGSGGTRDMGYEWMKTHLDDLLKGAGGIFLAAKLPSMLSGFCSAERADELARDLRPRLAGKTAELDLERTVERVRACGVLKEARAKQASKEMKTF